MAMTSPPVFIQQIDFDHQRAMFRVLISSAAPSSYELIAFYRPTRQDPFRQLGTPKPHLTATGAFDTAVKWMIAAPGYMADPLHAVTTYGEPFLKAAELDAVMRRHNISHGITHA
ncbi:MAG TPA: hypothetical protein VE085_03710 [Burkholderiales bacterium]|nr:hypothetical protein [Burkholderiales bacterium]